MIRRLAWMFTVTIALGGCGDSTDMGLSDLAAVGAGGGGPCTSNANCGGAQPYCVDGRCVECTGDAQCAAGRLCSTGLCLPGCSTQQPCGDAGLCETDAGVCRQCRGDGDCHDPANPRCDLAGDRCVPCLPVDDNCAKGSYCEASGGAFRCAPGCKSDGDCHALDGGAGLSCCGHACVDPTSDAANCGACGHACGAGGACCASSCVDARNDVSNCGACGHVCGMVANGTPACAGGKCGVGSCASGFMDCDGSSANGCETNVVSDTNHCGACATVCPPVANGAPGCMAGKCVIAHCDAGHEDCNTVVGDGCEVNLQTDANNCGACFRACTAGAHTTAACVGGACAIGTCSPGWKDCDGMVADGCETNVTADANNCGACNMVCAAVANGTRACINGVCGIGTCVPGYKDCNNQVADGCETNVSTSPTNCGACGVSCGGGACVAGICH